jgi:hypothetical protein
MICIFINLLSGCFFAGKYVNKRLGYVSNSPASAGLPVYPEGFNFYEIPPEKGIIERYFKYDVKGNDPKIISDFYESEMEKKGWKLVRKIARSQHYPDNPYQSIAYREYGFFNSAVVAKDGMNAFLVTAWRSEEKDIIYVDLRYFHTKKSLQKIKEIPIRKAFD